MSPLRILRHALLWAGKSKTPTTVSDLQDHQDHQDHQTYKENRCKALVLSKSRRSEGPSGCCFDRQAPPPRGLYISPLLIRTLQQFRYSRCPTQSGVLTAAQKRIFEPLAAITPRRAARRVATTATALKPTEQADSPAHLMHPPSATLPSHLAWSE